MSGARFGSPFLRRWRAAARNWRVPTRRKPPPAPAQAHDLTRFDEVVVTAQRREQKLQDVGIAVTPLGEKALEDLNITNATDIVRAVPSLKMNAYSSAQVVFNIRGVSQNDYGDQQEPPVAVYQDDSYSSSINLASFPVFDLARIETLRGPQGTLFGRNATGGAIQFISRKPTDDFEAYTDLTYGSYNQVVVDGAVSGPFTDNLQGRLAFIYDKDDGYMESIVAGVPDRGGNDHYAFRGSLAWQPGDATDVGLIVRYLKADKETQAGIYSNEPACPNAQNQGEFTPADFSCPFWGTGPGEAGTGFRDDAITPSRGGDPWKTAETDAVLCGPRDLRRAGARGPRLRQRDTHLDHGLPDLRQVLHRGGRRLAGRRRGLLPGQRPRPDLAGVPPVVVDGRARDGRRPLLHGRGRRLHRQVRGSVLRLRPGCRLLAADDLVRRVLPGRVELQRSAGS